MTALNDTSRTSESASFTRATALMLVATSMKGALWDRKPRAAVHRRNSQTTTGPAAFFGEATVPLEPLQSGHWMA
jgi:hypothetical protein